MKKKLLLPMSLLLTMLFLPGCGNKAKIYNPPSSFLVAEPFPAFIPFPELSSEFYERAPKADLNKLMVREEQLLGAWKKAKIRALP